MNKFARILFTAVMFFSFVFIKSELNININAATQGGVGYTFKQTFPDENMANGMAANFNKTIDSKITTEDCTVRSIELSKKGITNLSGIEHFKEIDYINISNNFITDLNPLSSLTKVTTVYAYNNNISNIKPLFSLTNIAFLNLSENNIVDISGIDKLEKLKVLNLAYNKITNIDAISKLKNLNSLSLYYNQIKKISIPFTSTEFTNINLINNEIEDISGLATVEKATLLYLGDNKLSNIDALKNLINTNRINLQNNNLTDISSLANKTQLTDLHLDQNKISDITSLENLTLLKVLYLHNNEITDIDNLCNLVNLEILWLKNNNIKDISSLKNMNTMNTLYLEDNKIENISALEQMKYLEILELSENYITDISVLEKLPSLKKIFLNNNSITNFSTISKIPNLNYVSLSNQGIHIPIGSVQTGFEHLLQDVYDYNGNKLKVNSNVYYGTIIEKNTKSYFKISENDPLKNRYYYSYTMPAQTINGVDISSFKVEFSLQNKIANCDYIDNFTLCATDFTIKQSEVDNYSVNSYPWGTGNVYFEELIYKKGNSSSSDKHLPFKTLYTNMKSSNLEKKPGIYQLVFYYPSYPHLTKIVNVTVVADNTTPDNQDNPPTNGATKQVKAGYSTYYYQYKNNNWFNYRTIYDSSTRKIFYYYAYDDSKCKSSAAVSQNCARLNQKIDRRLSKNKIVREEKWIYNVKSKLTHYSKKELSKNKLINTRVINNKYYKNNTTLAQIKEYSKAKKTAKYTKTRTRTFSAKGLKKLDITYKYKKGKKATRIEKRFNNKGNTKGKAYLYKTYYKKGKAYKTNKYTYNKKGKLSKAKKVKIRR
ncbi:leucine-rich repeat domain-containing protein [Erysipelotrichaceae bacterium OttesenSCG-928-M19]|nr:leucine-rich repeat domain-containing protein [Erysipelotrichaceae bacterium OttesenSCG-928-M19]